MRQKCAPVQRSSEAALSNCANHGQTSVRGGGGGGGGGGGAQLLSRLGSDLLLIHIVFQCFAAPDGPNGSATVTFVWLRSFRLQMEMARDNRCCDRRGVVENCDKQGLSDLDSILPPCAGRQLVGGAAVTCHTSLALQIAEHA